MTHTMTDEEYKEYERLKDELQELRNFKAVCVRNAKNYKKELLPCNGLNYVCDDCKIGWLLPRESPGICLAGGNVRYSK